MLPACFTLALLLLFRGCSLLAAYISNGNAFPQPLTEDEEAAWLGRLETGDSEARNVLIERNLRLVAHVVKKFDNTGQDNEDLISIGTVGLIKAINTFDRHKKTRLATYAARCIENEILMCLRSSKRTRGEVMLYEPIGSDKEGNEISLTDILGTEGDVVAEAVETEAEQAKLHEKLSGLSRREFKVLQLRYGLGNGVRWTQREIARALGISRSYVSRIEKRAIAKLYKEMYADGYR